MSSPQVTWDSQAPSPPQNRPQDTQQVSWDSEPSKAPASPTGAVAPQQSAFSELVNMGRMMPALIYSKVLRTDPKFAYEHSDEIEKRFSAISSDFNARMGKAALVKDDPLYMMMKQKGPEPFESHDMLENFIHDVSEFVGDPALYGPAILGLLGGPVGARVGATAGFALDSGLRKALADHYQKGTAVSAGDLFNRTAAAVWAATKGAAVGEAMQFAGGLPVGKLTGAAATALRGAYQAASMEIAGSVLDWHAPTLESFERNAVMVGGFGLISHGVQGAVNAKQGMLDVYAKDGTKPEQTVEKLQAQPPVKPEMKQGLQPAIRITAKDGSTQTIDGEFSNHDDLAEARIGERPVGIDALKADPKLADKILSQPEIQSQQVIDRAKQIKIDAGETLPEAKLESGRGFANLNGDYVNRKQALRDVKENEPEVYEMLPQEVRDGKGEFHSQDYMNARKRVADRTTMEGEPQLTGVSKELTTFLAKNRESLNEIKAGNKSEAYGKSVIRTLFTGPRNMVRAQAEQVAGHISKLLPDFRDQEALSFMRDYRDAPDELRSEIEEIRKGNNEKLKAAIPSMERALEPTPKMLEADKQMTNYFTQANDLRRQFVGAESSIDPARYSPRNFMHVEDEEGSIGHSKFAKRSPHDIRREYLRLLDPLKSGETEARTFNAVDELRIYGDRLGTSVGRSAFEMEIKNSELGKNGIAGQVPPELKQQLGDTSIFTQKELEELGGIPKSWKPLPGTVKTIVSNGKQFQTGLQVHPTVSDAMRPILENDVLSGAQYWKAAKMTQAYIKSIELGLSPFHMRALSLSFMNNAGVDAYRNALFTSNNSPEFEAQERQGALYGLTTTKTSTPYEAYRGLKPSSLEPRNTLLEKIKAGYAPVDAIFKGMTKATFEVAQRKFKVIDYSTKEAAWLAKNPNATDAEYGTAMRSIAKEVNAVYGGLNWDVMGVSANYQAIGRMFLLAPDWTFSNVANLKYVGERGPGGSAARMFWLKSFTTGYAMTQGMSLMLTGQMSKQPFAVYLGKDDKGKEMYSSMFLAGAPKDAVTLVNKTMKDGFPTGTLEFAVNKSSPLVGTGARLVLNKDWQGKPITKRGEDFGTATGKELAFGAEQLLPAPFVLKDMAARMMNPNEDLTYKDFLAGLVGASVFHEGQRGSTSKLQGGSSLKGGKGTVLRKR